MIELSYVCLSNNQRCIATCSISTWKSVVFGWKMVLFSYFEIPILSWISKVYLFWFHSRFLANLWTNLMFNIWYCFWMFRWKMRSILLSKRNSNWKQISSIFEVFFQLLMQICADTCSIFWTYYYWNFG